MASVVVPLVPMPPPAEVPYHERPYRLYRQSCRCVSELLKYRLVHAASDGHELQVDDLHRRLSMLILSKYAHWMVEGRIPGALPEATVTELMAGSGTQYCTPLAVLEATIREVFRQWTKLQKGASDEDGWFVVHPPSYKPCDASVGVSAQTLKSYMAGLRHHAPSLGAAAQMATASEEVVDAFRGAVRELGLATKGGPRVRCPS